MSNVIGLKEGYIKNIEKKAFDEFGAIKLDTDSYIIPANVIKNDELDYSFEKSIFFKDEELKNTVKNLEFDENSVVTLSCVGILDNGEKVLQIANICENGNDTDTISVNAQLDAYEREDLLNLVASYHTGKNLSFIFYIHYNFELLEKLFKEA